MALTPEEEYDQMFGGAASAPPPAPVSDPDTDYDRIFADTTEVAAAADATRQTMLKRGVGVSEADAARQSKVIDPGYYAAPRFLRAFMSVSPEESRKLFKRRAENAIERIGGPLAYWASRPQAMTTWKGMEELHKKFPGGAEALDRLAETMPEPGDEYAREAPSMELHDQLDDAANLTLAGDSWLDNEPQYMERLAADFNSEKAYVVGQYGGDWNKYQQDLAAMPTYKRIGKHIEFLAKDMLAPDPLFIINKPIKLAFGAVGGLAKLADTAVVARRAGVSLKEWRAAEATLHAVNSDVGTLSKHITKLETKLEGIADQGSDEYARVSRRLMEARAEHAARQAEAAEPGVRLYQSPTRDPETIYKRIDTLDADEAAHRLSLAEEAAPTADVEAALQAEGFSGIKDFSDKMDEVYRLISAGGKVSDDEKIRGPLDAFQRLPEVVREHLDALGVSRSRVLRAAALHNQNINKMPTGIDFTHPGVLAARAIHGPDDTEEAIRGLQHLRDGGDPADLMYHAADMPEHAVFGQGTQVPADGIFLKDTPDYRSKRMSGMRTMSRKDAMTYLLGREDMPGLAADTYHLNSTAISDAINKVGKQIHFKVNRFLPVSVASFAPEVAATMKKADFNYRLLVNESQEYLRSVFVKNGLARKTRIGTLKNTANEDAMGRVIGMLDAEVDPVSGTSEALETLIRDAKPNEVQAYRDLRVWFDAIGERLGLDPGTSISGYFPHLFPESDQRTLSRIPEYFGLSAKANVGFFALKNRTGAEGWSKDLIHVLDYYNRGAHRKIVKEPAFKRVAQLVDEYKGRGMNEEANYAEMFLLDARGMAGPSIFASAAERVMGERGMNATEKIVREATALWYKGLLGGNFNYLLQNMAGGTTNMVAKHGPMNMLEGLFRFATPEGRRLATENGVAQEALQALENMPQNASKALNDAYKVMDVGQRSEYLLRGLAFNTALSDLVNKSGKSWKALKAAGEERAFIVEAARLADRTQHTFGPLGRSPYMHKILGHTGYQFLAQLGTYPTKQSEFLLSSLKGDPGFIIRYLAYSGMVSRMAAEQAGVSLAPSVGFNFVDPVTHPRNDRVIPLAPGPEFLASLADNAIAWENGDPDEARIARERLHRSVMGMVPYINQYEKYARNLRESIEGKTEKFGARTGIVQVSKELFGGRTKIRQAERKMDSTQERIAHALGVRTVGDAIEIDTRKDKKRAKFEKRRLRLEQKANKDRVIRQREEAMDSYLRAIREGNINEAYEIYGRESAAGNMKFSSDGAQAAREAAYLRTRLQHLRRAPGFLPPGEIAP